MKCIWFVAGFILLVAASGNADISFSASVEKTSIVPGEQAMITVNLVSSKNLGGVTPPSLASNESFDVLRVNQNQSQSSSIQIINGKATQKNEIFYRFFYSIAAKKPGAFTFPALSLTIEGKTYATNPIAFTVTNEPVKNADVRVSILLTKRELYVGEQTILTLKVAQRAQSPVQIQRGFGSAVDRIEKSFGKEFSLNRLFTNQVTSSNENIGGEMHNVYTLRFALFALSPGSATVQPIPYEYEELHRAQRRRIDPFFDDFFGGGVQAVPKTALSNTVSLKVKTLPNPPANFTGAVGKVTLTASIDPVQIPAGDAVTLKIAVKGATRPGNIGDIVLPDLGDCEIFTPERHTDVDTTAIGISTRKTYKYMLIPRQEGVLNIGPISMPYFDSESATFKSASSAPLTLTVTAGKGGAKPQTRYLTQNEIREVGQDIRYIKTESKIKSESEKPHREPVFFLLYPVPFILLIFSVLFRLQSKRKEKHAVRYFRNRALRDALKNVNGLAKQISRISQSDFLGRISGCIENYISQKFGFAATGRTLDELKAELLARTADEKTVADLAAFIEQLNAFRFGGHTFDEQSRKSTLEKTTAFLTGLEKNARKPGKPLVKTSAMLIALLIYGFTAIGSAHAAPVTHWFETANKFYAEQQYDSAASYYRMIIDEGVQSSAVHYNIGNALFRLKKQGLARLHYEKALRLAPSDQDIISNIRFLQSNLVDKVPEPQRGLLAAVAWRLHTLLPLNNQLWIALGILFAAALLFSAALFVTGNARLWIMYLAILATVIVLSIATSMGYKIYEAENVFHAVVLSSSVDARNEPDGGKVLFTAHEGTKFRIRKKEGEWSLVSLPNGVSGWVPNNALGQI